MVNRPEATNSFEFITMAAQRAAQLMQGCLPRVPVGHKFTITAQLEVAGGHISKLPTPLPIAPGVPDRQGDTSS